MDASPQKVFRCSHSGFGFKAIPERIRNPVRATSVPPIQAYRQTPNMNVRGLSALLPGERGKVGRLETPSFEVRQRLLEMGLTKGISVLVIRVAPMGDPIEIELRGYRLSLRRKEAEAVMIEKEKP